MTNITLNSGHATPANIVLRALPAVALAVGTTIWLYAGHATPNNIILGDPTVVRPGGGSFPTQFAGIPYWDGTAWVDLCAVAEADYAVGMGGAPLVRGSAAWYALYLVESTDPDASPVAVLTSAGWKFIRKKT